MSTTSEDVTSNSNFDYEDIKLKFYDSIRRRHTNIATVNTPWSRLMMDSVISAVEEGNQAIKANEPVNTFQWRALSKYEVVMAVNSTLKGMLPDDQKVLVERKKYSSTPNRKALIPDEECYDIIVQAHLSTGHGNVAKMAKKIEENYIMRIENIVTFHPLCNICNDQNTLQAHESRRYDAFVIDFSKFPDNEFKYVLVLIMKTTGFVHLRPLTSKENIECAIELLKILTDFGPPYEINVLQEEYTMFQLALEMVKQLCDGLSTPIQPSLLTKEKYERSIIFEIKNWFLETNSFNWASGCRMVQWTINNTPNIGRTPYELVFGNTPNDRKAGQWATNARTENFYITLKLFDQLYNASVQLESLIIDASESLEQSSNELTCVICHHEVSKMVTCYSCDVYMHIICAVRKIVENNIVNVCPKCNATKKFV